MSETPEMSRSLEQQEDALETGAVYQDAEGRRTADAAEGAEHANSDADRSTERLERGETGPSIPED